MAVLGGREDDIYKRKKEREERKKIERKRKRENRGKKGTGWLLTGLSGADWEKGNICVGKKGDKRMV